jgi:Flp pilus assembly protein TadD
VGISFRFLGRIRVPTVLPVLPHPAPRLREGPTPSTASSRRKLAKVEDLDEREAKDLEVSHFYLTTGDFLGAYNRAKDAIRLYPDDAEAHFALAAAAQKLKKNEEAVAEYKSYLKLEPDGDHVKVAHRALTEIH